MALEVQVFSVDFFENINSYKANLTISQVIKFFEKYNIVIPKTTIQNFVRNEVVSEVVDKRYYTKQHLLEIIIALGYRDIFELSKIKVLNDIIRVECEKTDTDEVFYNIFNVNKTIMKMQDVDVNDSEMYLSIVANMTRCIVYKELSIKSLDSLKV